MQRLIAVEGLSASKTRTATRSWYRCSRSSGSPPRLRRRRARPSIVKVHQRSGLVSPYFQLDAQPGSTVERRLARDRQPRVARGHRAHRPGRRDHHQHARLRLRADEFCASRRRDLAEVGRRRRRDRASREQERVVSRLPCRPPRRRATIWAASPSRPRVNRGLSASVAGWRSARPIGTRSASKSSCRARVTRCCAFQRAPPWAVSPPVWCSASTPATQAT